MKIGIVTPHFYPELAGGIEWYTLHISRELIKLGIEVHVFTSLTEAAPDPEEQHQGIKIHRLKTRGWFYRVKFWSGFKEALSKHPVDSYLSFDYALPFTWQISRYAKRHGKALAILVYCIQSQKRPRHFLKQIPLALFDSLFAGIILRRASKILTRTPASWSWLKKKGISEEKLSLATPGLTTQELTPGDPQRFKDKHSIKKPFVLYLGRLRKQKGIFLLLEAFKILSQKYPNYDLVYVGPDDKDIDGLEFLPQLKEQAKELGLTNVHFLGPLYNQNKVDALAACTVLTMPSSYESFGQVFLQAMAQKKPVVATRTGGIPYVVKDQKEGFLIEPWDKQALVDNLSKLLENKDLRTEMGEKGYQKAQQFHYHSLAQNLIEDLRPS